MAPGRMLLGPRSNRPTGTTEAAPAIALAETFWAGVTLCSGPYLAIANFLVPVTGG